MAEIHDRSNAQEKRLARDVGGQRSARSGAGKVRKGDVRSERFMYEAKTTRGASYSITPDTMKTLRQHAFSEGRTGVLVVEIGGREYCVVDKAVWIEESGG